MKTKESFTIDDIPFLDPVFDKYQKLGGEKMDYLICSQVSKPSFETWFKPTRPLSFEGNVFVFAVPHAFAADWMASRYGNLIEEVLREITGNSEVKFKIVYPSEGIVNEKSVHTDSSKVDALVRLENRLDRIEEKLDKLLEVLSVKP